MNIARCDKRRTNDERNEEKETGGREKREEKKDRERETKRENERECACKGYGERIPSSLLGMHDEQSALYTPHPSSHLPPKGCIGILARGSFRAESLVGVFKARRDNSIRDLNPLCPRVCLENISDRLCHNTTAMI